MRRRGVSPLRFDTMSAQVMASPPEEGQPPSSPNRLRARLRAAQAAAAAVTTECASSSARVGKRVREDNEASEPAPLPYNENDLWLDRQIDKLIAVIKALIGR